MKWLKIPTFSTAILEENENCSAKCALPSVKPLFGISVFGRKLSSVMPLSEHFA